jgi:hypothetical protein
VTVFIQPNFFYFRKVLLYSLNDISVFITYIGTYVAHKFTNFLGTYSSLYVSNLASCTVAVFEHVDISI